jgi:hypothetical protein
VTLPFNMTEKTKLDSDLLWLEKELAQMAESK